MKLKREIIEETSPKASRKERYIQYDPLKVPLTKAFGRRPRQPSKRDRQARQIVVDNIIKEITPKVPIEGLWIMLTKKIGTEVSPPKLSIHWATPWPNMEFAASQSEKSKASFRFFDDDENLDTLAHGDGEITAEDTHVYSGLGVEHNWLGARKIVYKERELRVFPDEFNILSAESLRIFVLGEGHGIDAASHEFRPSNVAGMQILTDITDGETKLIYDAALLDGASHEQAVLVAMGADISDAELEIPPIGWYAAKKEYASAFCYEHELEE